MLYHIKCNNEIELDVSGNFVISALARPNLYEKRFKIVALNIHLIEEKINKVKFYCPNCNSNIDENEICGYCFECSMVEAIPYEKLYITTITQGTFCENCAPKIDNNYFKVVDVIENISIGGE